MEINLNFLPMNTEDIQSYTLCLIALTESTPESSPVKIWPIKSLPAEEVWIFYLPDAYYII